MAKILTKTKLSEHKYKTPEGYLICQDAILARTGKQEYLKSEVYPNFNGADEPIMVDRKPEQVFAAETLASFEDKPITVEHPDESVTPENYSELSVGHTRNIRKGKFNGQDVMIGDLVITDAQTIDDIENGIRTELSCGYDCDVTEGENPEQINIRGNHVALCEQGRAGIAKIIDSKIKDNSDIELRVIGQSDELEKVEKYVRDADLNTEYSNENTLWISNIAQDHVMDVAKDIAKKFNAKVTFSLVKKENRLVFSDSKSLEANDKKQLSKYFNFISKHVDKDISIEDIINPIKEMGFKPVREKIDGWNKMGDGYYRKDYFFTFDDYNDIFIISLYTKDDGDWKVNEVNAYFIGKKQTQDNPVDYAKFRKMLLNTESKDKLKEIRDMINEYYERDLLNEIEYRKLMRTFDNMVVVAFKDSIEEIDYKEFIDSKLNPEYSYDRQNYIIAQFASYEDATRAVREARLDDLDFDIIYDDSAVFLQYSKDDISNFINNPPKPEEKVEEEIDNSRYVIYAKGTTQHDGKALYWIGNGRAQFLYEPEAPKFTREYAEKVEASNGKYEWIKVKVESTKDSVDTKKYVVYRENGKIKGTSYDNYVAPVQDGNKIIEFNDFDNLNQVVEYLLKYTNLKREEIATTEFVVEDSTNYREKFYKNSKKLLEKKLKKLEDLNDKVKDENKEEYAAQKQKLREELKKQLESCNETLDEEDSQVKDSDPLSLNIKSWYMSQYPTDEVGKTLNDDVTFQDLFDCLDNYKDVYELLGGDADSIIRERVFEKLAELTDYTYEDIYNQWLLADER